MEMGIPTIETIVEETSAYFGVPKEAILDATYQVRRITRARHVAHFLAAVLTYRSNKYISEHFKQNHSTVTTSCKSVAKKMASDKKLKEDVTILLSKIRNKS